MKRQSKLLIISLTSLLMCGCPNVENSSSSRSSTSQNSTSVSNNNSSTTIISSNSQTNSTTSSSQLVETKLVITPSNFNKIPNIEINDVVENTQFPTEFTFNVAGVMKSNKIKNIKKMVIDAFSTYENLIVYNNYTGSGTPITSKKETGDNRATYTYQFNNENEFYIINSSETHRTHVYSIEITYMSNGNSSSNTGTTNSSSNNNDGSVNSGIQSNHYTGTYYKNVDLSLSGSSLKTKLRDLITNTHDNPTSYNDLKTDLPKTDASIKNPSKIVLIYSRTEVNGSWDNASTWNREHVWPKANGWFNESGAGSDLHHIRPEDPKVNSDRGNTKFGTGASYFEPVDEAKGDVARIIFYMLTRYSQSDSYGVTKVAQSMNMLLEWNELDPVDALEIQRNKVAEGIQGNRNPFIDYPELADAIW